VYLRNGYAVSGDLADAGRSVRRWHHANGKFKPAGHAAAVELTDNASAPRQTGRAMPRAVEIAALVSLPRFGSRHDRVGPREDQNGCNKGRCDEFFHGETMRARPWRFHHKSIAAPKPGDALNRMVANRLPVAVKTCPTTAPISRSLHDWLRAFRQPAARASASSSIHMVCRPLLYQLTVRIIGLPTARRCRRLSMRPGRRSFRREAKAEPERSDMMR
jgi:hypothetical protein